MLSHVGMQRLFGKGHRLNATPELRIRKANAIPVSSDGAFVLYWMTAYRRLQCNFALQRAVEWAESLRRPLVILEAIRPHYRWACDRFHQFMIDGMIENARRAQQYQVTYLAYVDRGIPDPSATQKIDLAESLARHACVTVTDDFPCFFHPHLYQRILKRWPACIELVDSNGILPMRLHDRTFTVAHSYRRAMQKALVSQWPEFPARDPLSLLSQPRLASLPASIAEHWTLDSVEDLERFPLSTLPIDHSVAPTGERGGTTPAQQALQRFVAKRLNAYDTDRNEPDQQGSSGLSSYLHFGHISPHEVFDAISSSCAGWSPEQLARPNGKMNGFWNLGTNAEAFMDQLMTWREIGFNMCCRESNYDRYESLPDWALKTLEDHAHDRREHLYDLPAFENATTHDPLWNAAQRQLVREGRIHNYLRMLWGKKILHWSRSPREALDIMLELNNKYALDGRDPNSYSGIFWVLGRYDRAWGPERPIFGKIRYMTSESTRSKVSVKDYLRRYAPEPTTPA